MANVSGGSFVYDISPSASVPTAGGCGVSVSIDIVASLSISFSGGIVDSGDPTNHDFLIGQQCVATIGGISGITVNSYNWVVSGCLPFKSYDPYASTNQLTPMGSETASSVTTHFATQGAPSVTCAITFTLPDGSTGSGSAFRYTKVDNAVIGAVNGVIGTVKPVPVSGATPSGAQLLDSMDSIEPDSGVEFHATVGTPVAYGGGGTGAWNQLVGLNSTKTVGSVLAAVVGGATSGINDGGFPYSAGSDPGTYSISNSDHVQRDDPYYAFDSSATAYSISDSFMMYVMYLPPGTGSMYVPLGYLSWGWSATANRTSTLYPWPVPTGAGVAPSWHLSSIHPQWNHTLVNNLTWQ